MYNTSISTEQELAKSPQSLIYEVIRYKLTLWFNDISIGFLKGLWLHLSLFKVAAQKRNAEMEDAI